MNKLEWLETEYIRNDLTMQPVLVEGELWYTVFDNHGYNWLFDTFLGLYEYLTSGKCEEGNCFESEDEMVKYIESQYEHEYDEPEYSDLEEAWLEAESNQAETIYFNS